MCKVPRSCTLSWRVGHLWTTLADHATAFVLVYECIPPHTLPHRFTVTVFFKPTRMVHRRMVLVSNGAPPNHHTFAITLEPVADGRGGVRKDQVGLAMQASSHRAYGTIQYVPPPPSNTSVATPHACSIQTLTCPPPLPPSHHTYL